MKIEKCVNGHFYDADNYSLCPVCERDITVKDIPPCFRNLGKITFLGKGSTCQVFKINGDYEYALKVVECGTSATRYKNALYELHIMEHLRGQDQVVQLCDYEIVETHERKTIYILEEYHVTMTDFLSNRTVFVSDAIQIMIGICDAISACKKCGILHLDIQPKNIYVDNLESIKIGDFSSSLFEKDAHSNNNMRGTLAYVAPEVYRNGNCSIHSDIYAVGLILYSLFNKRILPFMDSDSTEMSIYKRLAGTPLPTVVFTNIEICNELNRIIRRACSYSVEDRYQNIDELRIELLELLRLVNESQNAKEILYTPFSVSSNATGVSFDVDSIATSLALFDADTIATSVRLPNEHWDNDARGADTWDEASDIADSDGKVTSPNKNSGNDKEISLNDGLAVPDAMLAGGVTHRCRVCDNPVIHGANFCPFCGCKVIIETPDVELRKVEFSAIAPKMLVKGDYTIINVMMYEESFRYTVDEKIKEIGELAQESRSGVHRVKDGSEIKIILCSPDIIIDDSIEIGIWQGGRLDFAFAIFLPDQYKKRQVLFNATVYINDVVATKLKFIVKCSSILEQKISIARQDILSAFVSYASQDRNRVAAIIQGMKKARPDMDVFFDVDSLRSGDDWERTLRQEIEKRDILFLCWSHFARDSKWVDAEWRYALKKKGAECIEPVPIEPPDICPPPKELNHKHFNDKLLYIINAKSDNT